MTDDTPSTDYMNYNEIVEQALKGVVRESLERVAENGLPGEHHFYISFLSGYPDVVMPDSLRERYPEEITIVLQHEFWDLEITDVGFSVMLSFNNTREFLNVPWAAITGFADPSVQFGLQFKTIEEMEDGPVASPGLHPPGVRGSAKLSHQQREANAALDKLIAYWEKQDPLTQKAKDRAKVAFKENAGKGDGHGR